MCSQSVGCSQRRLLTRIKRVLADTHRDFGQWGVVTVTRHGKSVERGDMAAVASDLIEDLHPQLRVIGEILPNPCDKAEILTQGGRSETSCAHLH